MSFASYGVRVWQFLPSGLVVAGVLNALVVVVLRFVFVLPSGEKERVCLRPAAGVEGLHYLHRRYREPPSSLVSFPTLRTLRKTVERHVTLNVVLRCTSCNVERHVTLKGLRRCFPCGVFCGVARGTTFIRPPVQAHCVCANRRGEPVMGVTITLVWHVACRSTARALQVANSVAGVTDA